MGLDIDIEIEALQIEDMDPGQGEAIAAALRAELERLLAAGGLPSAATARIDAQTVSRSIDALGRDAKPAQIGARIAHSVYQGLAGAGEPRMDARPHRDD